MSRYFILGRRYFSLLLAIFFLLPQITLANSTLDNLQNAGIAAGLETDKPVVKMIGDIINVILGLVASIFIVLMIIAGFKWMTSAGNADQIKTAKATIINSVIGLAIILFSYAIVNFIFTALIYGDVNNNNGGGMSGGR